MRHGQDNSRLRCSLGHGKGLNGRQICDVGHALQVDGRVLSLGAAQVGVQQFLHVGQLLIQLLARQLDVPLGRSDVLLGFLQRALSAGEVAILASAQTLTSCWFSLFLVSLISLSAAATYFCASFRGC